MTACVRLLPLQTPFAAPSSCPPSLALSLSLSISTLHKPSLHTMFNSSYTDRLTGPQREVAELVQKHAQHDLTVSVV